MRPDEPTTATAQVVARTARAFLSARRRRAFAFYVVPVSVMGALTASAALSSVPPNLWVVSGRWAYSVAAAYGLVLVAAMATRRVPLVHEVGAGLSVLTFGGRCAGFVLAALDDQPHLFAAAAERFAWGVTVVFWHVVMAWITAQSRCVYRKEVVVP